MVEILSKFYEKSLSNKNLEENDKQNLLDYFLSSQKQEAKDLKDIEFSLNELAFLAECLPTFEPVFLRNFICYLLERKRYDVIITFLTKTLLPHIGKVTYLSQNFRTFDNIERTFDKFVECTIFAEIDFKMWQDVLFLALNIDPTTILFKWKRPATDYVLDWVKRDEKGFYDFVFKNFSKYGISVFELLFQENVASATSKLLEFYLNNDFEEKRQVKNILKQHYEEVSKYVEECQKEKTISVKNWVKTLLIYSFDSDVKKVLQEIYLKEKDEEIKKLIIENITIKVEKNVTLAQAKKNSQKMDGQDLRFFGISANSFPKLILKNGEEADGNFVAYYLNSYKTLFSPKACFELSFFQNMLEPASMDVFSNFVADKILKNKDEDWAFCLICQNITKDGALDVMTKFIKNERGTTKNIKKFIKFYLFCHQDDALWFFDNLNKADYEQKLVLDALLQGVIESELYNKNTVELLRDKMTPNFPIDEQGIMEVSGFVIKIEDDYSVSSNEQEGQTLPKEVVIEKRKLEREVARLKKRFENAFHSGRTWKSQDFDSYILSNNLMKLFASRLLWGRYIEQNLISVFKIEDGQKINVLTLKNEENQDFVISIFHPVEFIGQEWKYMLNTKLAPFNQLNISVYPLSGYNTKISVVSRFNGLMINANSFFSRMQEFGWKIGQVSLDGMVSSFIKTNDDLNVLAELCFSPILQKNIQNSEAMLYELRFYKQSEVLKTGNNFITNKKNSLEIGVLKERYFSDIIYEITLAAKK